MRKYYEVWKLNQENWAKRGRNAHEEIVTYHHWKMNWTRKFSSRCKESQDAKKELNSTYKIDKKKFDRELGKKQVNAGWLKRERKKIWKIRTSMGRNIGRRSKERPQKITEMEITKHMQSYQNFVEHFQLHKKKYNQLF